MKVVNISRTDWANFGYDNEKALESVGVTATSYCMIKHPFDYPACSLQLPRNLIIGAMRRADVVQIFHSCVSSLNMFKESRSNAKLIVYHAGTIYRNNPQMFNDLFNPVVIKSVVALGEFSRLGSKNEEYIVGAIDTGHIQPVYVESQYLRIAHFPSNAEVKGTDDIRRMIASLPDDRPFTFDCSTDSVKYIDQLTRMQECDIYIELFKPILAGKKYGSWGITALEAACMGKIVVTQNLSADVYERNYGECPFILVRTEDEFIQKMRELLSMPYDQIRHLQERTREWVVRNHSYKATGERIVQKILTE